MNLPNARIPIWYRDGIYKITLKPNEHRSFGYSEPDDEGYHFAYESLFYDATTGMIYRETVSGGRDCDGMLEHTTYLRCHVTRLNASRNYYNDPMPDWEEVSTRVYDQYAQLAGY